MESSVELDAKNQHVTMIDEELLGFDMKYADFEIADLCHDTKWLEKSANIFRNIVMSNKQDSLFNSDWPETQAYFLWQTIKSSLKLLCPFCQISQCPFCQISHEQTKAFQVPLLRNAVIEIIHDWMGISENPAPVEYGVIPPSPTPSSP